MPRTRSGNRTNNDLIRNICRKGHEAGIRAILAHYDGSGDEGQVDSIRFFKEDPERDPKRLYDDPDTIVEHVDEIGYGELPQSFGLKELSEGEDDLLPSIETDMEYVNPVLSFSAAVEQAVLGVLPGGWEINEGSYGFVTIVTNPIKVYVSMEERIETTDHSDWEVLIATPSNQNRRRSNED